MAFMSFSVTTSVFFFTVMHNPVFEHSDTLSFALLASVTLYLSGKQFRCGVFTFVQYIFNYLLLINNSQCGIVTIVPQAL